MLEDQLDRGERWTFSYEIGKHMRSDRKDGQRLASGNSSKHRFPIRHASSDAGCQDLPRPQAYLFTNMSFGPFFLLLTRR
jgi:hypothetical protein